MITFEFLDSFRGFFAFSVAIGHWQFIAYKGPWGIVDHFHINIGVFGFFVLSSFLLTYRLVVEFTKIVSNPGHTRYKKFSLLFASLIKYSIRRIARIHPLYIVVVLLVKYGPREYTRGKIDGLPENFWHVLFAIDSGTTITWTIHVEMTYYLIVPFVSLCAALCGKKLRYVPIIFLILAAIYADSNWTVERVHGRVCLACSHFPSWASAFFSGSITALVYYWLELYAKSFSTNDTLPSFGKRRNVFENILSNNVLKIINLFCYVQTIVFVLLVSKRWSMLPFVKYSHSAFYNIPAYNWALILLFMLISRGSFSNVINNRFWNYAGKISYSIYLTHWFYLDLSKRSLKPAYLNGFEGIALYIFLFTATSSVTYCLIEYPGMWLGSKLCHKVDILFERFVK